MKRFRLCPLLLLAALLAACSHNDDFTPPAFLHLDAITTAVPSTGALSADPGFYRSDIVAAYVVAHYPGASKVDTIGLFRLPFTTPVLHSGPVDYLAIYPAVEQSGISGALPFYTFYNAIRHTGLTLTAGDTLDLDTDTTTYNPLTDTPLLFEPFEVPADHIRLNSPVEWVKNDPDNACTGNGYGLLRVPSATSVLSFTTEDRFVVTDPSKILYLELDIKSDLPLQVQMISAYSDGTADNTLPVMVINPIDHWQHLYINLGRTWSYFNHHSSFQLSFAAVNQDGTGGDIRIDNIKLLTTSVSL